MQDLIELRECLHDTGVTSAVYYQYVPYLGFRLVGIRAWTFFCCLGWLLQLNQTSDLYLSLMTTISVHVPADTLNKFSK